MLAIFIILWFLTITFSVVSTIPLAVILLTLGAIVFRKSWIFAAAFFLGLIFDLLYLRPLGYTSIIFCIFVFLVFLYERKFEVQTVPFVFFGVFLGSFVYLKIFGYNQAIIQSAVNAFLGVLLFKILNSKIKN